MPNGSSKAKQNKAPGPLWAWALGYAALLAVCVCLVYYWRVFYYFTMWPAKTLTLAAMGVATVLYVLTFLTFRFVKSFNGRVTAAIVCCGVLFCFANPPMQAPDEANHFLRLYAISMGRFNFDAQRTYPDDVDLVMHSFGWAWANHNNGYGVKEYYVLEDPEDENSTHIMDERIDITMCFKNYYAGLADIKAGVYDPGVKQGEPLVVMLLPYLPGALFMALARLLGFSALGCLYAGRLANLLVYAALCFVALQGCKRYKPVFVAFMLLPLSLFIGASLNYDSLLMGLYFVIASFYCKDEIYDKDLAVFLAAFVVINIVKPWISLLWLALPLVLPKTAWKTRLKKAHYAAACIALALAATWATAWYGVHFRYNYGVIGRMLPDVVQGSQLSFILSNIPRFIAITVGTLYENNLFLGQLGLFGSIDLAIPLVNLLSPLVLFLAAALSVHEKSSLKAKPAAGLFLLALTYTAGVIAAMYITYTPVGMVRVIGLQARYFLPPFLLLFILLAALLSHRLEVVQAGPGGEKALQFGFVLCAGFAVVAAVLLFQHYYIGPVGQVLRVVETAAGLVA